MQRVHLTVNEGREGESSSSAGAIKRSETRTTNSESLRVGVEVCTLLRCPSIKAKSDTDRP